MVLQGLSKKTFICTITGIYIDSLGDVVKLNLLVANLIVQYQEFIIKEGREGIQLQ